MTAMPGASRSTGEEKSSLMRCAIYTRKSSEEGLAQEFNSLDAQRESAEAYILSQRHAGWIVMSERYDDGGYTGANLERPALQRLLADIDAGTIGCVVLYKVDRLSRSLLDFARLMGRFEERGVNLVSVTQQFNTTTSLGRLTLNILLSFAQFEREIIAERTRDKMSAARRKGKWVGGVPVLGYDVAAGGGKLVINEEEAHQVRAIFALYLQHRGVLPVLNLVRQRQWTTKRWTTRSGRLYSGRPFACHDLSRLLTNVIYVGKVDFRGQIYQGEHDAIVEEGIWQRVQSMIGADGGSVGEACEPLTQPPSNRSPAGQQRSEIMPSRLPRITRLLALAMKFERLIQQGAVKDYAELARLGRVSRARITQIMNLLNLAPDIREQILYSALGAAGDQRVRETTIRKLSTEVIWSRQRELWKQWSP
jgi:DNA invertase Pin-like site-specific DNA recombinase